MRWAGRSSELSLPHLTPTLSAPEGGEGEVHHLGDDVARNLAQEPAVFFRGGRRGNARHHPVMRKSRDCCAIRACRDAAGSSAVLHGPNTPPDHVAHHDDAAVGGGEMFETVPGDAAMDADLRVVIAGDPLPFLVGPARVLPETGTAPRFLALGRAVIADLHRVRIVERHRPGRRRPDG